MINLFQVDKSGGDIFEKDYSIVLVVNKEKIYGVNVSKSIKDRLISEYKKGNLNIKGYSSKKNKNRFRLRFHTSIVIKLMEFAISDGRIRGFLSIQICNDFDGHFHEIKDMIFKHLSKKVLTLKTEDILQVKFAKPSLIDDAGKAFRNNDKIFLKKCILVKLNVEELIKVIKK